MFCLNVLGGRSMLLPLNPEKQPLIENEHPPPPDQHNLLQEYLECATNSERVAVPQNATEATVLYRLLRDLVYA